MTEKVDDSLSNVLAWPLEPRGRPADEPSTKGSGDGTYDGMDLVSDLRERMVKVETAIDGLRHSQNILVAVLALAVAVLTFGGGYLLNRVDALDAKVDALPGEIGDELRDLTTTLGQTIAASRSGQPPQVIIVPSQPTAPAVAAQPPPQQ